MDGAFIDQIDGKHYDLLVFENEMVRIESCGRVIRVGIKKDGIPFSWWEPTHPFKGNFDLPQQNGWDFRVETPNNEETRAIFTRGDKKHILTLICTNPNVKPKPIKVCWE